MDEKLTMTDSELNGELKKARIKMGELKEVLAFSDAKQGGITKYSYAEINGKRFLSIKQDNDEILLTKHHVLFLVKNGQEMVNRWKVTDSLITEAERKEYRNG
ncbi:MAG: hypothetical protein KAS04_04605 [Candidatus Aenigmarchaeota archaeon]|nr:hypothetical protein [Candidatus Aenigmarchaeota archaeon]